LFQNKNKTFQKRKHGNRSRNEWCSSLLQNATTTGNGDVVVPPPSFRNHTITIAGVAGVSSGAIQVETSDDPIDTGNLVAQEHPDVSTCIAPELTPATPAIVIV